MTEEKQRWVVEGAEMIHGANIPRSNLRPGPLTHPPSTLALVPANRQSANQEATSHRVAIEHQKLGPSSTATSIGS